MQRAIVALGEALAHSVGPSEKRRLLAFTPPTFPWTEYWLRSLLHSPHSCSLCGGLIRRTPQGSTPPGLVERSARHCKSIDCPGLSYSMPFGHGSHHVRPFGAPSGLLIRHALHKYGELHARTHARPLPVSGSSLCVPVRVEVHASKRAAFPRRMSVHFRVSFLPERGSRLALEWPSQRPNISISPRESFELTDPRTSISFSLIPLSYPFHSFLSPYL